MNSFEKTGLPVIFQSSLAQKFTSKQIKMTGGGDGNRTHVRNTANRKHYMFILRIYVYNTSKTQHVI